MKKIASIMAALVLMCAFAFAVPQESKAAPDNVGIYLIEDFSSGYEEYASVTTLEGFWSWCASAMGWPAADAYIEMGELCIYANAADAFFFNSAKGGAPKEEMANAEYLGFHVNSNLDKEMLIGFFGTGDPDKQEEGEAGFQMIKDNMNPDEVQSYSAYLVTDDGEVMATRNNPDRVMLPANFKGYVIYNISDYRNNRVTAEEDNTIDLSKTSIKTIGLNINADDVDVDSYLSFDNFFICGEGVTNEPGDIATTDSYVQLDASMFYGVDINSLDNVSPYPDQGGTATQPADENTPSATEGNQTSAATDSEQTSAAPSATENSNDNESAGFPVWAWIVIAVAVVAVIVIIAVVAGKKNKGDGESK